MTEWMLLAREQPLHQSDCLLMDDCGRVFYGVANVFDQPPQFTYPHTHTPPQDFVPLYWLPLPRRPSKEPKMRVWIPLSERLPPEGETVLISVETQTFAGKYVPGSYLEDGVTSWLVLPSGDDDVAFLSVSATHFWCELPPPENWGGCP